MEKYNWYGRVDGEASSLRYHQIVEQKAENNLLKQSSGRGLCLIGFASDEGVRRNKGRVGAAQAPNEIRRWLANIAYHLRNDTSVIDIGNIVCENKALEEAQERLGKLVNDVLIHNYKPIILGGGHETTYGHYLGVRKAIGRDKSLGIINLDAHFDLRLDETPSSGTMFRQILERDNQTGYLCVGIQRKANTKSLFDVAKKYNCKYVLEENVNDFESTRQIINDFCINHDYIMLTLCTDVIDSTAAPGVSAPATFGLEPKMVRTIIRHIVLKKNIISFDICEVNPLVDEGNRTARLAANILDDVISHFR